MQPLQRFQKELDCLNKTKRKLKQTRVKEQERSQNQPDETAMLPSIYEPSQEKRTKKLQRMDSIDVLSQRLKELQQKRRLQERINDQLLAQIEGNGALNSIPYNKKTGYESLYEKQNCLTTIRKKTSGQEKRKKNSSMTKYRSIPKREFQIQQNFNISLFPLQKPDKNNPSHPKKKLKRLFRVYGLVALFCVYFRKYSRSFTVAKYNIFKKMIKDEGLVNEQLYVQNLFQRYFYVLKLKSQPKRKKSLRKNQKNLQSDLQLSIYKQRKEKNAYKITIEKLRDFLLSNQLSNSYDFLSMFLPQSFIPIDYFYDNQIACMNIDPHKGYSQCDEEVSKVIILRVLFLKIFQNFCYQKQINSQLDKNAEAFWTIYLVINDYCKQCLMEHKDKNWQKKLKPSLIPSFLETQSIQIDINAKDSQLKGFKKKLNIKRQKYGSLIRSVFAEAIDDLFEKLKEYKRSQHEEIKQYILQNGTLYKQNDYFYTHLKQKQEEIQEEKPKYHPTIKKKKQEPKNDRKSIMKKKKK